MQCQCDYTGHISGPYLVNSERQLNDTVAFGWVISFHFTSFSLSLSLFLFFLLVSIFKSSSEVFTFQRNPTILKKKMKEKEIIWMGMKIESGWVGRRRRRRRHRLPRWMAILIH